MVDQQYLKMLSNTEDNFAGPQSGGSVSEYNSKMVKMYIKKAPISCITLVLLLIIFLIEYLWNLFAGYELSSITQISVDVLIKMGANVSYKVVDGQVQRLVSAMFLHAGLLHIMMNGFTIILACCPVEMMVKWWVFVVIYLISGIQGNMTSVFNNVYISKQVGVAVGASTSLCGVIGLYMVLLYIKSKKQGNVDKAKKTIIFIVIYLVVISLLPRVDFFGHMGGLISGSLLGTIFLGNIIPLARKIAVGIMVVFTVGLFSIFM